MFIGLLILLLGLSIQHGEYGRIRKMRITKRGWMNMDMALGKPLKRQPLLELLKTNIEVINIEYRWTPTASTLSAQEPFFAYSWRAHQVRSTIFLLQDQIHKNYTAKTFLIIWEFTLMLFYQNQEQQHKFHMDDL